MDMERIFVDTNVCLCAAPSKVFPAFLRMPILDLVPLTAFT